MASNLETEALEELKRISGVVYIGPQLHLKSKPRIDVYCSETIENEIKYCRPLTDDEMPEAFTRLYGGTNQSGVWVKQNDDEPPLLTSCLHGKRVMESMILPCSETGLPRVGSVRFSAFNQYADISLIDIPHSHLIPQPPIGNPYDVKAWVPDQKEHKITFWSGKQWIKISAQVQADYFFGYLKGYPITNENKGICYAEKQLMLCPQLFNRGDSGLPIAIDGDLVGFIRAGDDRKTIITPLAPCLGLAQAKLYKPEDYSHGLQPLPKIVKLWFQEKNFV